MKLKGVEFKEWYDNHFPVGYYHDGDVEIHNAKGQWLVADDEELDPDDLGELRWSGIDYGAETNDEPLTGPYLSFSAAIENWRRDSATVMITAHVPKDRENEAREMLAALGATRSA